MLEREGRRERTHDRVWELLPWYVSGTLPERDLEGVETHLAGCRRCQEEERICRRTAGAVKSVGEVAPSPHPVQLQRMLSRIDESDREERSRSGWWQRSALVRSVLVAQAAVILLLAGALVWQATHPVTAAPAAPAALTAPAWYRTLADPAPAPSPATRLRVMFSPGANEREIRQLLLGVGGEIKAGPSPLGVYTLEVPAGRDPVAVILARLRSEPQVAFAERAVDGDPGTK